MKNSLITSFVLSTLVFSNLIFADEIFLPFVKAPAILKEGTQRQITPEQINELLPWAKNSKMSLKDTLNGLHTFSSEDKKDILISSIQQILEDSEANQSQLFMRYILNRAFVIGEILDKEVSLKDIGSIDVKNRFLIESVKMAIRYADVDMSMMLKKTSAPYAVFGIEYFDFLKEINKSIFDASAQYKIEKAALEFLQWDLYRDLNNKMFAPQITKIYSNLKRYPDKQMKDSQRLSYIRQMKLLEESLELEQIMYGVSKEILVKYKKRNKENLVTIDTPLIRGNSFSDQSTVVGACMALGYLDGLAESKKVTAAYSWMDILSVDDNGKVVSKIGPFNGVIVQMTCLK